MSLFLKTAHMFRNNLLVILFFLVSQHAVFAQAVASKIPAHDPVMIKQGDRYYMFATGFGISVYSSSDMNNWTRQNPVFTTPPAWAMEAIPGFKGHIWAPDITFHNGQFYLYYAVSAFGKNTSAIGLAINKTLDTTSADYKWRDVGSVVQSVPGRDMWNAIDPNLIFDDATTPWLAFGSFWNGLKLVKLTEDLTAIAKPEVWHTIAARPRSASIADTAAGDAAIEAPFIFKHGGYYYLFASWDYCCRAEKSTYKVVVGRSKQLAGPYLDKAGTANVEQWRYTCNTGRQQRMVWCRAQCCL